MSVPTSRAQAQNFSDITVIAPRYSASGKHPPFSAAKGRARSYVIASQSPRSFLCVDASLPGGRAHEQ